MRVRHDRPGLRVLAVAALTAVCLFVAVWWVTDGLVKRPANWPWWLPMSYARPGAGGAS